MTGVEFLSLTMTIPVILDLYIPWWEKSLHIFYFAIDGKSQTERIRT